MPRKAAAPSLAEQNAALGGAAAVDRALGVLTAFNQGEITLSLGDISQRTGLYKSTALRLIASLSHAGMIQKHADGRYSLGATIARLHQIYVAGFQLANIVQPALVRLTQRTGESAGYHVRQGNARLCLYRHDCDNPIRDLVRAGDILPLERGSGGRLILAYDPPAEFIFTRADAKRAAAIRNAGFCANIGDRRAEVAGISAPVFTQDGEFCAALTLTLPAHRYSSAHIPVVMAAARALSLQLPDTMR